jgi:hypothetical protein
LEQRNSIAVSRIFKISVSMSLMQEHVIEHEGLVIKKRCSNSFDAFGPARFRNARIPAFTLAVLDVFLAVPLHCKHRESPPVCG